MKKNIGMVDKVIRILMAVVLVVLFFTHVITGTVGIILLVLSAVLVLTSIISFCPIYFPFGLSARKQE